MQHHHEAPAQRRPLLHIALASDWATALTRGTYDRSTRGTSQADVGFIHCSGSMTQVETVLRHFYDDVDEPLMLLHIDEPRLAEHGLDVRWEPGNPSDPGSERFPHLYGGPLPVELVLRAAPL